MSHPLRLLLAAALLAASPGRPGAPGTGTRAAEARPSAPDSVRVPVSFSARFGDAGAGPGQFRSPQALDADPNGFLYVADTGNHRVQKIDAFGRFVASVGGFGREHERFNEPVSVWAGNGLDVFVADYDNRRVERYDKDLHYLASLESSDDWSEDLRFAYPLDAVFTPQSELFCLDGEHGRVLKLDVMGRPQVAFGGVDSGENRLFSPRRLFVSKRGWVCVSDDETGRLSVFDTYGNPLFNLGEGMFDRPAGMTDSPTGNYLFVADPGRRRVFVFRGLEPAGSFGDESLPGVRFVAPADVACGREFVYVLDRGRSEIFVFRWDGPAGGDGP